MKSLAQLVREEPRAAGWRRRLAGRMALGAIELAVAKAFRIIPRPSLASAQGLLQTAPVAENFPPLPNPPTISMVTPSYQQGRFLEWTLRSVLEQNYPKLEYVVMDGGSTDETREILPRYADRLTHLESSRDRGQADAIARGFKHTTGEIMAYLNSDDVLAPGALQFVARYFAEHPRIDAIYSHRIFIDEQNIVTRHWILAPHRDWMMQRWDFIPQETCFWRRRLYEEAGGIDPDYQFALDYDLFVRFMRLGKMERVDRFLAAFRAHPASKTSAMTNGEVPAEVARVRAKQGVRMAPWQRIPALAQAEWIEVRSRKFAAGGRILPGALKGIGYDYNLVWGGRLNPPLS